MEVGSGTKSGTGYRSASTGCSPPAWRGSNSNVFIRIFSRYAVLAPKVSSALTFRLRSNPPQSIAFHEQTLYLPKDSFPEHSPPKRSPQPSRRRVPAQDDRAEKLQRDWRCGKRGARRSTTPLGLLGMRADASPNCSLFGLNGYSSKHGATDARQGCARRLTKNQSAMWYSLMPDRDRQPTSTQPASKSGKTIL
jgi:hypothetical protein